VDPGNVNFPDIRLGVTHINNCRWWEDVLAHDGTGVAHVQGNALVEQGFDVKVEGDLVLPSMLEAHAGHIVRAARRVGCTMVVRPEATTMPTGD
jgi:hypothetical protein